MSNLDAAGATGDVKPLLASSVPDFRGGGGGGGAPLPQLGFSAVP